MLINMHETPKVSVKGHGCLTYQGEGHTLKVVSLLYDPLLVESQSVDSPLRDTVTASY